MLIPATKGCAKVQNLQLELSSNTNIYTQAAFSLFFKAMYTLRHTDSDVAGGAVFFDQHLSSGTLLVAL